MNNKLMSFSLERFHSDVIEPQLSTSKISNDPLTWIKLLLNIKYHYYCIPGLPQFQFLIIVLKNITTELLLNSNFSLAFVSRNITILEKTKLFPKGPVITWSILL